MSALDLLDEDEQRLVRRSDVPAWTSPTLATLTDERFSDAAWVYERKLDGERALAFRDGDGVRLLSRNRKRLDDTYPEVVDALADQRERRYVVDGEVVAFDGNVTSFARLQGRMQTTDARRARRSGIPVFYYVFDLLHVDGHDVARLPLRTRKRLLRRAFTYQDPLRFLTHRNTDGEQYWREACRKGWEGVIAKRADEPYAGKRSHGWLKFTCAREQEVVIGGFTEPKGSRHGLGALLVGYYDDGDLVYAGKIGTGFDEATLADLRTRMDARERGDTPFARGDVGSTRGVHWVRPELVCEAAFTEWTTDGRLRHPRYLGLRRDKDPRDVRREEPA